MVHKTVVLDVVGLTRGLVSAENTPFIHGYLEDEGATATVVEPAFPALTCTAQSCYTTGVVSPHPPMFLRAWYIIRCHSHSTDMSSPFRGLGSTALWATDGTTGNTAR